MDNFPAFDSHSSCMGTVVNFLHMIVIVLATYNRSLTLSSCPFDLPAGSAHPLAVLQGLPLICHTGSLGHLGALPPPVSLMSVPVCVSPFTTTTTYTDSLALASSQSSLSIPPSHPVPSASIPLVGPQFPMPSQTQPGMILSPSADPIPQMLVQRAQSGQFVEMRELLADNIALYDQLASMHGTSTLPFGTVNRTRFREVPSLISWVYCFNAYVAIRTSDPLTRDMLAYSRILIREALRHGGDGWLQYDRVFRRHLSINPLLNWNVLEPGLQASTMLGQRNSSGIFCTLCRESDHISTYCALAPLQQQLQPLPSGTPSQAPRPPRPPRRPETLLGICVNWNKGICTRPSCSFRHVCASCQLQHRARDCPDTPPDSEYKAFAHGRPSDPARARR